MILILINMRSQISNFFDRGFDFYAPQSFEDESGRRILIGWMGIPDADYTNPTEEAGWQHALTIPRELSVRDGKLIQEPIEELKQLRSEDKAVCTFCYGQTIIMQNAIYEAVVDFKRCREMVMTLREGITLSYKRQYPDLKSLGSMEVEDQQEKSD